MALLYKGLLDYRVPARIRRMSKRRQIIAIPKWQHRLTCAIQRELAQYMKFKTPDDMSDALALKEWMYGFADSLPAPTFKVTVIDSAQHRAVRSVEAHITVRGAICKLDRVRDLSEGD